MAKKLPLIRALDIKPDQIFCADNGRKLVPVRIVCTEHHGWQRGFVRLTYYRMDRAVATAVSVLDPSQEVNCVLERYKDEWFFRDGNYRTLQYLPLPWVDQHLAEAFQRKLSAERDIASLTHLRTLLTN